MAIFMAAAACMPSVRAFVVRSTPRPALVRLYSNTETSVESAVAPPPAKVKTSRVLSGVQPTGSLHLGNYLGAIRQWVDFQNAPSTVDEEGVETKTENFFCVVDLHAITMPHDPKELSESTLASAALYLASGTTTRALVLYLTPQYLACTSRMYTSVLFFIIMKGIDPAKSRVFVQSHVPAHSELAWLLSCIAPMNWLERMIQFKDKAKKQGESVGTGLFTYPVLMAADILLYQADRVPVGEDQRQHLELSRDLVRRFTDLFGKGNAFKKRCKAAGIPSRPVFVEPNAMILEEGARIMSLTDGTNKMSKSDPNDASRINVLDPPDVIRDKVKKCKTDAFEGIEWNNPERPEATNLLNIYHAVQPDRSKEDIVEEVKDMTWGEFKPKLADAIVAHLEPIQKRYAEVRADDEYLMTVLKEGAEAANEIAERTLYATRVAMGFVQPANAEY